MSQKITITVGGTVLSATLNDSQTIQEFQALLPLRLPMSDLLLREKFAYLAHPLSENGQQVHTFEVGDIVYFAPASAVAIFYRQDGAVIANGLYLLGQLDAPSASEALRVLGEVALLLELAA